MGVRPGSPRSKRLAVVTGGGSGLGRAFCFQLSQERDWHVVVNDLHEDSAAETLRQLEQSGGQGEMRAFDVTDEIAWGRLREQLQSNWVRLDLLVNNAGACASGEIGNSDPAQWRRLMDLHYHGALTGCFAMVPWMKSTRSGAIINIASIAGWLAAPAMGAYSASKAAVVSLTETLHAELRQHGVRVTLVGPGFFPTGLLESGDFAASSHRRRAEELTSSAGFTAEDVARAALIGVERNQLYVVLGARARFFWRWKRFLPSSLVRLLAKRYHQLVTEETNP